MGQSIVAVSQLRAAEVLAVGAEEKCSLVILHNEAKAFPGKCLLLMPVIKYSSIL